MDIQEFYMHDLIGPLCHNLYTFLMPNARIHIILLAFPVAMYTSSRLKDAPGPICIKTYTV